MLDEYNSPFGFWDVQHVAVIIKCTPDRGATIEAVAEVETMVDPDCTLNDGGRESESLAEIGRWADRVMFAQARLI